jgi:hypothetical protein
MDFSTCLNICFPALSAPGCASERARAPSAARDIGLQDSTARGSKNKNKCNRNPSHRKSQSIIRKENILQGVRINYKLRRIVTSNSNIQ